MIEDVFEFLDGGVLDLVELVLLDGTVPVGEEEVERGFVGAGEVDAQGGTDCADVVGIVVLEVDLNGLGNRVALSFLNPTPFTFKVMDNTLDLFELDDILIELRRTQEFYLIVAI